uniref:C3H1-type domain-containing protein n=1 Tax=Noccaea caerulescens TaxID=107243 RepID=A0A1J3FRE9_NOCCA
MDSSQYNPIYGQWNLPYTSHLPPSPLLPPPPPLPHPPRQSHLESPNFYIRSSQSGDQRHDYHHYSHRQDIQPNPAVTQPSASYYPQHPPPQQQQHPPPQQPQHLPYIPEQVSYVSQRISQPSSSIPCTESRDISQSAWVGYKEKRLDSWKVDASQGRMDTGQGRMDTGQGRIDAGRSRVNPSPGRNYQYDYNRLSRDSSGVSINRGLDGNSRSRDEYRSPGYVRKESGATRIEGNYQHRGQLKPESDTYFRGLEERNRGLSSSAGYSSERYGVTVSRDMNRSSASHEGARNQRWGEAHNGGRTLYPRKKDDYYHSEIEQHFDRGRREASNESDRAPRKQMQKKSALLRLETPRSHQNGRENDWSRHHSNYSGKRFNSNSSRGKEHLGYSNRGVVERQRGRSPVDLDVSFKSNVMVAKPVASPSSVGVHSGLSMTPRSSKARRALMSDKNEKASVAEGNEKLRTHLSDEASVSEGSRQPTRQTTASEIEKKYDNHSTPSTSDAGGKLNKVRFVVGVVQDSKVKITDTGPEASTHDSEAKIRNTIHAAEKISSFCEASKEAKDDTDAEHDIDMEVCLTDDDVIDGDKCMLKSHEDVLDRKGTDCNADEAPVLNVMEKEETVKTKTKVNTSHLELPVSCSTAADLSSCSGAGTHFAAKSICGVGSKPCEDEDMECIPSRNSPMMEVDAEFEERNSIGSSIRSLGYGEKAFENSSLDASIYFNREDPGDQVVAKSDISGIGDDNKGNNKNVDSLSPENDFPRGPPKGLISSASVDIASVSAELANANNSVSGHLANADSFTVGTYTNTMVNSSDMCVVLQVESKNLPHGENAFNQSVENVNRKESMEATPLNSDAEMAENLDSESKQTCVNGTSSSLTKVAVKGSSNFPPVERTDGCSRSDESDLAMAVPSEVCVENVSSKRLVPDEDLGLASHHPAEIPSVDQFSGLKACLPKPNISLSKDITDGSSECLVARDVSQNASTTCDNLPSSSAFVIEKNLAIGIIGMSADETVTDAESGLHETQPCSTVCKFLPEDRFGCGSSGAAGSVWNLSMDKDLEKDPSKVNSCLVSDSSVSPCHISPLVAVNEQVQNKTSIQAKYSDSQGGIVHEENDCAENVKADTLKEKTKPSGGTSKYRPTGTNTTAVTGDSVFPCDSLSSSPRQSLRQIRSEIDVAAMVPETSKDKPKPKPYGGTSKYRNEGSDIVTVNGDSVPRDSLSSSPRLYRQIRSEIHVASMVDETNKYKDETKPSGGTSKYRTPETDVVFSGDSMFSCNSLSSSPSLSFRQIRSEIHVAAMVDETSKVQESQNEDILLDTLQDQIMTSHEVTQAGSSVAHSPCLGQTSAGTYVDSYNHPMSKYPGGDIVEKPNGDPIEKLTDVASDVGSQEKYPGSAKIDMFDGDALSSDGKVYGTEILGDSGVRLSRSHSRADVKFALSHVKDHVASVPHQDSQSKTSLSSRYDLERRKKKSDYSAQKSYPRSLPFVPATKKDANPPTHITKRHTWHRKSDTSASPFVAAKPLSSSLSTQQKFPQMTAESSRSYVRKGNSLLRKPSYDSSGVSLGLPPSAIQLNRVEDKSTGSASRVDIGNASFLVKTGEIPTLEWQSKPPSDSSTSKVSNAIATSSGKCALTNSMDHLTTGLPESIMDSATSGEASVQHSSGDTLKTSEALIQTGYASDCQPKKNPPKLDSSNLKRMIYVKRKANQLVAASDIHGASKNQIHPSDGYFKRSKNQLVRTSESRVNHSPDDALHSRPAATMVPERSSSSAFSDSAVTRPYKQSKFSLVWTQNDPKSKMPISHMRYQSILPQLVPWKRVTYWRRLMNSVSTLRNGSFSNISQKLSMMRKRHTVYTRSTNGYSLRKSKVLSVGGSHLKWSKSIERDSRKANEEATLAVAAISKKESEKHSGQSNTRTTSRNHLARERVFRFGSLRYKMDSSRRTLQRISDVDSPCSGLSENGKGAKIPFIPNRLVIGNEEYVRVGNGNQLVRDPKKRTRALANEKVRWSLHNARLRSAKKKKYCQFFTRFGKCNKDDGKCPYVHDPSKIAVCTKFLNGLCANANCKLTHKVIPERMPDCSYFLQGLCNNEACPYRHVHVNPSAAICDGFLKGYCSDGDECRKKHSYICPVFEATGSCSQGSKCKLHHPKNQSKGRKRKRPSEPSQKNARGRYFGSLQKGLSEPEPMVLDGSSTDSEAFGMEGLDFIILGAATEYESGDNNDTAIEQSISSDNEEPVSIYNLIRPVALMQ